MFRKAQTREFECLESPKFRIPMFGKAKIHNSNVWKSQNSQFHCLEEEKSRIAMFGKAKNKQFQCLA